MGRPWLLSFEFTLHPPFLRRMQARRQPLSERLELLTFLGKSGVPKRYMILRNPGRFSRLGYSDTAPFIWFWAPTPTFRKTLKPGGPTQVLGPGSWHWTRDLSTLLVLDDMEFQMRPDEARALEIALFGSGQA